VAADVEDYLVEAFLESGGDILMDGGDGGIRVTPRDEMLVEISA
jgi:hypothetical protein